MPVSRLHAQLNNLFWGTEVKEGRRSEMWSIGDVKYYYNNSFLYRTNFEQVIQHFVY